MSSSPVKEVLFKIFHGIFFILCVDLIGTGLWSWAVVRSFEDHVPKAPVAVVLVNDFDIKTGDLGPETLRRLDHVFDLYQEGSVDYILCVGGARPQSKVFGSESMRRFLIEEGIPEGKVFLEKKSFDSKSNWNVASSTVKNHGWDKLIVVSSPFHLHRFRRMTKENPRKNLSVFFSPYSVKYARPLLTYPDIWMQVHYEWAAHFSQILPEKTYNKMIKRMRGQ